MQAKNKQKDFLHGCPIVENTQQIDLRALAKAVSDPSFRSASLKRAGLCHAYRLVYRVGVLKVVGYIVLPKKGRNLPAVILLRGGSEEFGMITPNRILSYCRWAERGYITISTQYPGVEGGDGKDAFGGPYDLRSIMILKVLLQWCGRVDLKRIGMMGHSRGGLMVYMILRSARWIKAAVIGGAPTDEFRAGRERRGWRRHQIHMFGRSRRALNDRSPIKWVRDLPRRTPLLIMHGSADWRVSADHSILMSRELYKNRIPHRLIVFEGADHGITEFWTEYMKNSCDWFDRYLSKNRTLPNLRFHGE